MIRAELPSTIGWWERRLLASHHEPRLAGALLDRRYVRYAIRRLRGFALARGAAAVLYVVEASVLLLVMPIRTAILALIAANLSAIITSFWWGATEALRRAVRADARAANAVTATWLWWAIVFGGVVLASSSAIAWTRDEPIAAVYTLVLGMRVAADLPLRVWHSRVAARKRIHRIMWLQLVVEATGPLLVLALSDRIGVWGFFLAMSVSTIVSRAMTWYFIRRAYRAFRRPWIAPAKRRQPMPWIEAGGLGLGGIATRIPSLLGVVFLAVPGLPLNVAIGFNMTIGALSAAGGWAWAYYLDFLALDRPAFARIRRRLERMVMVEAVIVGVVVGAAALAIIHLAAPRSLDITEPGVLVLIEPEFPDPRPYALALPAIAIGLSLLAAAQVIAWTRGALLGVIVSGIVAAAGLRFGETFARWAVQPSWFGDAPPGVVRTAHIVMGIALVGAALALWVATRRARLPSRQRVTWEVARAQADTAPAAVTVFTLSRAITRTFEPIIERAGATWWAYRGRRWLVAGLDPAACRAVALECAGIVIDASSYATEVKAVTTQASDRVIRFDRPVASHRELSEHQLQQVWYALRQRLAGGPQTRAVTIASVEFQGDAVVGLTARFHERARRGAGP